MNSDERLASVFLRGHPEVAARLLESMDAEHAGEVLQSAPAEIAAAVLGQMLPTSSARCAERLAAQFVAALLEKLPSLSAAALLRHFPAVARDDALKRLSPTRRAALNLVLRYPPSAVGAWMEPRVLTLPDDCSVQDASQRLERADHSYPKIYILDRGRKLRGAVRGLALFRSEHRGSIAALLEPIEALWARESVASAQKKDIWERESEVPVVNRQDEFVGVVSYADLRKGYRQSTRPAPVDLANQDAGELAELFLGGLEGAWQSLGEIISSEQPERQRGTR